MTKRPIWKVIVFTIITLGVYELYWLYKTRLELVAKGQQVPRVRWLLLPLLGLIVIAALQFIIRFALAGHATDLNGIDPSNMNTGGSDGIHKLLNILSILVGVATVPFTIIYPFVWFYRYCKAASAVTQNKLDFSSSYVLWIVLSLFNLSVIWYAIVQNAYNKIDESAMPSDGQQAGDQNYASAPPQF